MAKRRTRKEKEKAKHDFKISWDGNLKTRSEPKPVKSQLSPGSNELKNYNQALKKAKFTAKEGTLNTFRHDIVKSLLVASLILSLELVLYLFKAI